MYKNHEINTRKNGSLCNSSCRHLFTLLEDLVMARKIKPQRITESCYFYLSLPPCHSVVFRNLISKISKSFRGFGHCNAMVHKDPKKSCEICVILWLQKVCGYKKFVVTKSLWLQKVCSYKMSSKQR